MIQDTMPSIIFWVAFMVFGPSATNAILYVIHDSEIFDPIRGYVEARYPQSKIEYLINCKFCLSYWISLFIALLFIVLCIFTPLFGSNKVVAGVLALFLFLSVSGRQVEKLRGTGPQ